MIEEKKERKKRRVLQMARFYGAAAFTLITMRLISRAIKVRKYVPSIFQQNYKLPPFSQRNEAMSALTYASAASIGTFSTLIFGFCWALDISTAREFVFKTREFMGVPQALETDTSMDEETSKLTKQLQDLLSSENNK
ncbi:Altered inheritance of mitochondria protein 11 [Saccharomyces cerevisiae]|uniref:Altered inheritance of mitochondria protein 11 n=3 Tax=Saccharomyces cerevisiae TaxID=4932 RepID=AIM11_YEAS7|nr:RecName: Full=Altered inheritance of mitochondria protein 11; AltName: Full=Genetic interactor of prohibitins 8 [Saccharomyces cerevisiae YJM789]AJU40058.1 Aim11p [Saccharomyces cerevisiae YJM693]AJU42592.1 Aim11p [Saccharomyces cerevisiae YJM1083]AJU43106.1 Aim11p [Saccharomyces cerevisiae YJM1133]AJU44112.1 Aim11p [Saccharomyces cerevisiae YJM1208]AJU44884.1 Aim11p [Saccharomyces cerevisiae YJM1248]AJU46155.1 Aim11p [Saccharomyces cerevisiae YJM1304]AJU46410.1 Aim11p [Saccharomyces cere